MKYTTVKDLGGTGSVKAAGGDNLFSQINQLINNFKSAMQLAKELRALPGAVATVTEEPSGKDITLGPDKAAKNPALVPPGPMLGDFLTKYGDLTVEQALELIKPMTLKQLLEMVQHGIRPRK